jgi:hypothetical protein
VNREISEIRQEIGNTVGKTKPNPWIEDRQETRSDVTNVMVSGTWPAYVHLGQKRSAEREDRPTIEGAFFMQKIEIRQQIEQKLW